MTVGILYICTGNYTIFWRDFYLSCEKHFIKEATKKYFVFTDADSIEFEQENKNIIRIYQQNLGWPDNTLKRFHMFGGIKHEIAKTDYIFFFNANMLFIKDIHSEQFLCTDEDLLAVKHPGHFDKKREEFPYENNPLSKAYIAPNEGKYYFMGGLNGGKSVRFMALIDELISRIDSDLENGIVACFHDESHINRYFIDFPTKILGPEYGWPEGKKAIFPINIIIRNKKKWGGHAKLRGYKENPLKVLFKELKAKTKGIFKKHIVKRFFK